VLNVLANPETGGCYVSISFPSLAPSFTRFRVLSALSLVAICGFGAPRCAASANPLTAERGIQISSGRPREAEVQVASTTDPEASCSQDRWIVATNNITEAEKAFIKYTEDVKHNAIKPNFEAYIRLQNAIAQKSLDRLVISQDMVLTCQNPVGSFLPDLYASMADDLVLNDRAADALNMTTKCRREFSNYPRCVAAEVEPDFQLGKCVRAKENAEYVISLGPYNTIMEAQIDKMHTLIKEIDLYCEARSKRNAEHSEGANSPNQ
jgi:hypothetical protein